MAVKVGNTEGFYFKNATAGCFSEHGFIFMISVMEVMAVECQLKMILY